MLKYTYKDVVFKQTAGGWWTDKVLAMVDFDSLDQLAGGNKAAAEKLEAMGVAYEAMFTLLALKMLEQEFAEAKTSWNLVAKKAFNDLRKKGFADEKTVREVLDAMQSVKFAYK